MRLRLMSELFLKAPEADRGRVSGSVELKEGVENTEEGGSRVCEGCIGRGGGEGVAVADIVAILARSGISPRTLL